MDREWVLIFYGPPLKFNDFSNCHDLDVNPVYGLAFKDLFAEENPGLYSSI